MQVYASMILGRFAGRFGRAVALADSFVGVAPPNMQAGLIESYNMCQTPMVRESATFSAMCASGDLTIQEMFYDTMKAWPNVTFANINSKTDLIQILFYDLWTDFEAPHYANIEGIRYFVRVNDYLDRYNESPNYISYLLNGGHHVFLEDNVLYTADPQGEMGRGLVAKPLLVDWISGLVGEATYASASSVCNGIRYDRTFWSKYLAGVLYCAAEQTPKFASLS
ncbi:unnamed protein product [Prorocentrum cordatum]|uniref:Phospholipase B-like n=1 Tax=Prorocentrum cordatum TaxID=2364126 RepID=A0ABN9UNC3_9DINO|nr:unnamed protein product [Polarella glacialis]